MPSSDMDLDRPKSREESVLTENTDDFIIGDRVWVNGTKPGYIQYLGETRFSPGDWAGVVLDDHSGKNDGSVAGVRYFQCEPRRGVFARLHKLTRYPLLHVTATTPTPSTPTPPPMLQRCLTPTRTPSPGARSLREGDRVTVCSGSAGGPPKSGVLRYLGQTDFAAGEWAGVELDEPLGKNDGTVAGKRYFRCLPSFGLFSPAHKVNRISGTGSLDRHRRQNTDSDKDTSSFRGSTPSLQDDHRRYTEESEKRAQRLRQLLEAAEGERRILASKLEEERKKVEELEFRIEEECIGKDDLESEREGERRKIEELERRLEQEIHKNELIAGGATPDSVLKDEVKGLNEEIKSLREKLKKSESKVQDLEVSAKQSKSQVPSFRADELVRKEEALLQAQLTLDNKKREIQNLLNRISEQDRDLEKSKSRQKKQLETIDELNIKLQKFESKSANLAEELHSSKEKCEETERRLKASKEQISQLEAEKKRLEQQLVSPESTPQEQALHARLQDREKEVSEWRKEAEKARSEADRLREEKEKMRREAEEKTRMLSEELREEARKEKKKFSDSEESYNRRIRELERSLSTIRSELESSRMESEARLTRQEARLQEADLRAESLDRLREHISRLQAEKDLIRVEKEETLKRLQISEQSRTRWEMEANRASDEVNLLKSSVQHLRTEFANHREDLVKKLAQTEFDAEAVQSLHLQIEEQRRVVEMMQQQLKHAEVEREHLQTELSSQKEDKVQVENGFRQDMESLKRRLAEAEAEKQSVKRSLEAAQLLIEERTASQRQLQIQNTEKLEAEKINLESKIKELQKELSTVRNGKVEPDLSYDLMKSEKEALEQQVNFMNSVIVDMQHKNDDLRSRLEILETEVIFDGNLHLTIPQQRSRLFCDICNVFNVHDTEDCPKQLNSVRRTQSYSSQESEF